MCSKCELSKTSIDAHTVSRSANYSWLCEEGLKRVMKNVLTNLTEEPPQLWLFQSPSSRFIMTQTFMKFASERAREESSSKMSVWETLRLDHVK